MTRKADMEYCKCTVELTKAIGGMRKTRFAISEFGEPKCARPDDDILFGRGRCGALLGGSDLESSQPSCAPPLTAEEIKSEGRPSGSPRRISKEKISDPAIVTTA